MKQIEIRIASECSDGVYRGFGKPVFVGNIKDARRYVSDNPPSWPHPYDYDEVSYKKGVEVKRKTVAGINGPY